MNPDAATSPDDAITPPTGLPSRKVNTPDSDFTFDPDVYAQTLPPLYQGVKLPGLVLALYDDEGGLVAQWRWKNGAMKYRGARWVDGHWDVVR